MTVGRYSRTAVALHFLIALAILFLFVSSWWMLGLPLPSGEYRFREFPFQLHKNIGLTLVIVLLLLLTVRLRHRPATPTPDRLSPRLHGLSLVDHVLLYVVILACCISGYMSSSYSGWETTLWWAVELPYWGREDEALNVFWSDIHLWTCWLLLALLAAHIGGVLYHAFRNDGIVRRMLHL